MAIFDSDSFGSHHSLPHQIASNSIDPTEALVWDVFNARGSSAAGSEPATSSLLDCVITVNAHLEDSSALAPP